LSDCNPTVNLARCGGHVNQDQAMSDRLLALVRHGQSEWNLAGRFAGRTDVDLTEDGVNEARNAGRLLKAEGLQFDAGFTSTLRRAQRTLAILVEELGQSGIPVFSDARLDERDYGELVGLTRAAAIERWGAERVNAWRRSYDAAPPGGESLKDTAARVLPCYEQEILPRVLRGERVLIAAHGNCLRALVMVLEELDAEQILHRELSTGMPVIYWLGTDATVVDVRDLAE
jgi:2,3-bisphosphoglycerate-dependent phosphoglycerate mutase